MKATLSTERLVLRDAVAEDVARRLAAGPTSPEILRAYGQSGAAPVGLSDAERWVSGLNAHPHAWVVVDGDRLLVQFGWTT